MEVHTCENDLPIPDYKIPIETRLVKYLRIWRDDSNAVTPDGRRVEDELALLLEWYICQCIEYGPNNLGGWWSDGVGLLEIHQIAPDTFKLLGVTWIDCLGIAPFEIDVELGPALDSHFTKTTFRIGVLDDYGKPTVLDSQRNVRHVLKMRPRRNQEWAMAVELTPPEGIQKGKFEPKR